MAYLLGKGLPREDNRTLLLADFVDFEALPPPPPAVDNTARVLSWGVYGNDRYGDCVVAGWVHALMLWAAEAAVALNISEQAAIDLYLQLTGGVDRGLVVLDFLNTMRKMQWEGSQLLGYAKVDPRNILHVKQAIAMFSCVLKGLALPSSAESQVGGLWDVGSAPASWGRHLVPDVAYNDQELRCITWGQVQRETWNFNTAYCDELYVPIPTYPIPGFDQAKFISALKDLGTYIGPDFPTPVPPQPVPPSPPPPPPPSVVITPDGATVVAGQSQQFTANVPVAWSTGFSSSRASIDGSGLFTATARSAPGSDYVIAVSLEGVGAKVPVSIVRPTPPPPAPPPPSPPVPPPEPPSPVPPSPMTLVAAFAFDCSNYSGIPTDAQVAELAAYRVGALIGLQDAGIARGQQEKFSGFTRDYYVDLPGRDLTIPEPNARVFIDIEVGCFQLKADVDAEIVRITQAGLRPGIYGNLNSIQPVLGDADYSHLPYWNADPSAEDMSTFVPHNGWTRPDVWQYTETVHVGGFGVCFDLMMIRALDPQELQEFEEDRAGRFLLSNLYGKRFYRTRWAGPLDNIFQAVEVFNADGSLLAQPDPTRTVIPTD